ncbi:MAG: acetoin utilization protein AcuC [Gammaproteobacteria bacterium]|nr:acetoin utilization protein AcuC [Gammaproteobacteria bacterium]
MLVYAGEALAEYGFGHGHPFGPDRFFAFWQEFKASGLDSVTTIHQPVSATREDLLLFHDQYYVERVARLSQEGFGMLDADTPVFPGVYEAALTVVGSVLDGVKQIMNGTTRSVFVPIAGLHHAHRGHSAGFCVFNDCGIAIEALRARHGVSRVAYVDIDAHHGDGVFYEFESDPDLIFADFHEDGRYLYPGTGRIDETGKGKAAGHKLNLPLPPGATNELFLQLWPKVESFLEKFRPEFIILQCGADSLAGDPLTHLALSDSAHGYAAERLFTCLGEWDAKGLLALGGGGYNRDNLARAWNRVVATIAKLERGGGATQ